MHHQSQRQGSYLSSAPDFNPLVTQNNRKDVIDAAMIATAMNISGSLTKVAKHTNLSTDLFAVFAHCQTVSTSYRQELVLTASRARSLNTSLVKQFPMTLLMAIQTIFTIAAALALTVFKKMINNIPVTTTQNKARQNPYFRPSSRSHF